MEIWGWVILMFVVVAVLTVLRAFIFAWDFSTRESWSTYFDEEHRELYRMMEVIHKIFEAYGIPYWITAGSLLGAAREKGILKWDDDIDLCVVVPHEKVQKDIFLERWKFAMMELKKDEMYADPYALSRMSDIIQIESTRFKKHRLVIDICLSERAMHDDRVVIQPKSLMFRKVAPNEFFFLDEVEPLALYPFGDSLMVWGPAKPGPFLARSYPGCHLTARVKVPHTISWFLSPWCQLVKFFLHDYPLTNEEQKRMADFLDSDKNQKLDHKDPVQEQALHEEQTQAQTVANVSVPVSTENQPRLLPNLGGDSTRVIQSDNVVSMSWSNKSWSNESWSNETQIQQTDKTITSIQEA